MKLFSRLIMLALLAAIVLCPQASTRAESIGGPGGTWPESWPKELEPLREKAWTWEGGLVLYTVYHTPFANREEFEAAWPHLLKVKSEGTPLTLKQGTHVHVKKAESAGILIFPPLEGHKEGPQSKTRIVLVVDGEIVDLNRIRLPADTAIIDQRFKE